MIWVMIGYSLGALMWVALVGAAARHEADAEVGAFIMKGLAFAPIWPIAIAITVGWSMARPNNHHI
jgi:hypothetical protein